MLVVDDNTTARVELGRILEKEGVRVRRATSGVQAVNKMERHAYDFVLMDANMPGPLDGVEAARRILASAPGTPIVFTTAFLQEYREAFATVKDNLGVFEKPLVASRLSALIGVIKSVQYPNDHSQFSGSITQMEPIDPRVYQALAESPELLGALDWRLFERLLADMLQAFGYEVELTQGTRDGGIDIIAIRHLDDLGPEKYLLQAKRWGRKVGVEPVQQLLFLHGQHRATKSCLATTSTFTKGAWQLGDQFKWQLSLRDYKGLLDWVARAQRLRSLRQE